MHDYYQSKAECCNLYIYNSVVTHYFFFFLQFLSILKIIAFINFLWRHFFSMLTENSLGADKVSIYCIYCCPFSLSKKGRYRRIMSLVTIYAEAAIYVAT